jgi:transcriptional regulator with XRE-family HTH domain
VKKAQKEQNFRAGDRVEVQKVGVGYARDTWYPGVIVEVNRSGANVKMDGGHREFHRWAQIRREEKLHPRKAWRNPEPIATIGDAVGAKRSDEPGQPANETAPSAESEKQAGYIEHSTVAHRLATPIGIVFETHRRRIGLTQQGMASKLRIANGSKVSAIENGLVLPDDDILMAFAELTGADISDLIERREQSRGATDRIVSQDLPKQTPLQPLKPAQAESPAPRHAPVVQLPTAAQPQPKPPTQLDGYEDFVERVYNLIAIPTDLERRRRWFALARELFELSKLESR